ncbi:hypothetical protein ACTNET_03865 [Lactobacillus amylovorus]|uniref:hypothetical protein n=1 Tax=Lactobacillus amylovorus TaxID=1604 RepID=UPI003F893B4A
MAQRRMFSKRIVESARFLKMPPSTQNLYFHLGLNADDDGVVEGYNVMMQTGATEDDLKLLVAKGFVTVLNDDLVTYINDWRENNRIRADRKVDSIYKNLLVKMIPDIELQPSRRRADTKKKPGVKRIEDNGRPLDNQRTTSGPHSLGQDRSGQDSLGQVRSSSSVEDEPVDKDDDDDKKEKLLNEIRKTVKEDPTDSEWSSIQLLFKKLSWERLRLVTLGFNSKVAGGEIDRPYPYLLTVLRQKVEENR